MATGANPLMRMGGGGPTLPPQLLGLVMGALQNRTAPGGGAAAPLSEGMAANQGADPTMIQRQLEQVNQILGVLFVRTFQTLPNVANQISATMKQLSRALKEIMQASNVTEAVADVSHPPIEFGAAKSGENSSPTNAGAAPAI